MKKNRKSAKIKLDPEERDLLSSFEKGEWKTVANVKKRKITRKKSCSQKSSKGCTN